MKVFLAAVLVATVVAQLPQVPVCQNGGKLVGSNCHCKEGYTGKHCEITIRCCLIYGDPHFLTFDGAHIDFQGSCSYQAAGVCPCIVIGEKAADLPQFNVMVDTWRKGRVGAKVSWTRSVTVQVYNHSITLDQGTAVQVNGATVMLPYKSIPKATIQHTGDYVRVETEFGASVSFDGITRALICVPESWHGKTCGICGNNNGDKRDDYVTKDGTDVYKQRDVRGILIGNSWRDPTKDISDCKEDVHEIKARPSRKWQEKAKDQFHCGAIVDPAGPFAKCIAALNNDRLMSLFRGCLFDVYENQGHAKDAKKMACNTVEAFVTECKKIGKPAANNWREFTECKKLCEPGFRYSYDAPACPATCSEPDAPEKCSEPNTEGCVCRSGLILSNNKCVPPKKCGCTDEQGSYHALHSKWYDDACTTRFRCLMQPGKMMPQITTAPACPEDRICKAVNGQIKCVRKPVPGGWSDWSKWSDCQKFGPDEGKVQVRERKCNNPKPKNGGKCEGKAIETKQCLDD